MTLRSLALVLVFIGAVGFSSQAHAGILIWDWNYSTEYAGNASYDGSGTFTTDSTPVSGDTYLVTDITGTMNGNTITGLIPRLGYESNDNLLSASGLQLSVDGLSFVADGTDYNLFRYSPIYQAQNAPDFFDNGGNFYAFVPIPEPSQYGIFIALAAAGCIAWRRFFRIVLLG